MTSSNLLNHTRNFFLLLCLTLFSLSANAASHAAKIIFSSGDAYKTGSSGQQELRKGDEIFASDSVHTGKDGRVQMRFTDGGLVSLMPGSTFAVEQYSQPDSQDGGSISMNLVKGGLRTITGSIGKDKPENYQLKTEVATLGIRGTEFVVVIDGDTMRVGVSEGAVFLTNDMGELLVPAGQNAVVFPQQAPQASDTAPDFVSSNSFSAEAEQLAQSAPSILDENDNERIAQNFPIAESTRPEMLLTYAYLRTETNNPSNFAIVNDEVSKADGSTYEDAVAKYIVPPGMQSTGSTAKHGNLTYEQFDDNSFTRDYIWAPGATNLPMTGTLSYSLAQDLSNNNLTQFDLNIHLGKSTTFDVVMDFNNSNYVNKSGLSGNFDNSTFNINQFTQSGTNGCSTAPCTVNISGIVTGNGGSQAGAVYHVQTGTGGSSLSGAAFLDKK